MNCKIKYIELVVIAFFCIVACSTEPQMREIGKTPKFVPYDEEPIPVRRVGPFCPVRALLEQIEGSVIVQAEIFEDDSVGAEEIV